MMPISKAESSTNLVLEVALKYQGPQLCHSINITNIILEYMIQMHINAFHFAQAAYLPFSWWALENIHFLGPGVPLAGHTFWDRDGQLPLRRIATCGNPSVASDHIWSGLGADRNRWAFRPSFSSFELISPRIFTQFYSTCARLCAQQNL